MKTGFSFSRYFIVSLKIGSFTIDDGNANQASQINNLIGREKKNKRVARAARTLERFSAHLWFWRQLEHTNVNLSFFKLNSALRRQAQF